jgi:hypothetical protein
MFMRRTYRILLSLICVLITVPALSRAADFNLKNSSTTAVFDENGLTSVKDLTSGAEVSFTLDDWSLTLDGVTLRSQESRPRIRKTGADEITYGYQFSGYQIEAVYRLKPGWRFVTKQLKVLHTHNPGFAVHQITPVNVTLKDAVGSAFIPSNYEAQIGQTIAQTRKRLPGRDYGAFLRLPENNGAMLVVQNPYLDVEHHGQSVTITYAPEMQWQAAWGTFASDIVCIGPYHLSGQRLPREMALEWKLPPSSTPDDGMDRAEIAAFTDCVHAFLIDSSPAPISVEVGWTLNDYQIDTGTLEGMAEYKRILDTTSELGIQTLLYAPGNSKLSERTKNMDTWGWEYVLWLNLGQKIRSGTWNPAKDPIPESATKMVAYAKQKNVGLLAYVYPSVPFAHDSSWLVKRPKEEADGFDYASLGSRKFQDYLIRNLVVFQQRTGIAGYSFDYTWLNLSGSSSYAQWYGWRRVMESLRRASPHIVIDGRQSYQMYGPWSWLAGSYPHPTGADEQPESFQPYPDLHFDRVSADRTRFVNYWYRNYQFAPAEVIPGYATHQTERSMNVPPDSETDGHPRKTKMIYTRDRTRDWDYLGFRYSFLSSIATGGWNNVVDMIPARDSEEAKHFSAADKTWIREWLNWTTQHKEYVRHTRTILQQPAVGHVDGTSMIVGDRGYLFLFNPNYRSLPADFHLDATIGLAHGEKFLLREVYPQRGRLLGKPGVGLWSFADEVRLSLDGTSATAFELIPAQSFAQPIILNAASDRAFSTKPTAVLTGNTLSLTHIAGEPGTQQEIGVLLPTAIHIQKMSVNGEAVEPMQTGHYVSAELHFSGSRFAHSQQVSLAPDMEGALKGAFVVPQRILAQLANRKKAWPIPWTSEDYETTWLAPERLLLFVQIAEASDEMPISATLDGQPLPLTRAYSSTRVHSPSFVGFYADLSKIAPDTQHSFTLDLPRLKPGQFQGLFFDNVEPQFTEELTH